VAGTHRESQALEIVSEMMQGPDEAEALLLGGRIVALLGLQGAAVKPHAFELAVLLLLEQSATQLGVVRIDVDGEGRSAPGKRQDRRMKQRVA